MPQAELNALILGQLQDGHAHSVPQLVESTLSANHSLYESDVKSAVLGLVRRNQIELTDDFKVQRQQDDLVLVA
jgi:hypothetical protein